MQIELYRIDYMLIGLTSQNCLKLLPSAGHKQQQKVVVGDDDGILQLFSIKKENIQIHFKTLPGPKITSVKTAGAIGTPADKIFIASENEVRGYNKKGKMFLNFNTNLTENITSMCVIGTDLFVCGSHMYNHYKDCKDTGSYLCGDRIVDIVAFSSTNTNRITSVLACEGRMLRVLEHSRVIHSIEVDSSPTVLHLYDEGKGDFVLYGTVNGDIGALCIGRSEITNTLIITGDAPSSSVSCLDSYDLTDDEVKELIIGRQDGTIQVYTINLQDKDVTPVNIYNYNCNESITGLQGGVVGNQGYNEILVTTYTGRVFGLTTELIDKNAGDSNVSGYSYSQETQLKMIKLKSEIEDLEQKLVREREKYQLSTQAISDGLSAIPMLAVKDSFILHKEDASYTLTLEAQTAIDNVLLQSDVPIDLLDVEKNSAVVSYSKCDPQSGNYLLATYRCQINTSRLEVKIRTIEGQSGMLQAYVTPLVQPKCCQVRQYKIKPLSLHRRVHSYDSNRPFNILTLKGPFSMGEIHTWVSNCLPEVPEKPPADEKANFTFASSFIDTVINCLYGKGEAQFSSDNISTISIMKDFISKEATKKKINLTFSFKMNNESIEHALKLFHPKLQTQTELNKQISILNALHELDINDEETVSNLSPYYQQILKDEKVLKETYAKHPSFLDRLCGMITDLYTDRHKFIGLNAKAKIPQLLQILDRYNLDELISFFTCDLENSNDDNESVTAAD